MQKGFSLFEVLISIAILVIIMGAGVPIVAEYYQSYRIVTAQQDLVSVLRKAQSQAMTNQHEDAYGLYVSTSSNEFVVFRGASYASRTVAFDDSVVFSAALNMSGVSEVVFSRFSGRPSATGTISIVDGDISKSVTINEEGRVDW